MGGGMVVRRPVAPVRSIRLVLPMRRRRRVFGLAAIVPRLVGEALGLVPPLRRDRRGMTAAIISAPHLAARISEALLALLDEERRALARPEIGDAAPVAGRGADNLPVTAPCPAALEGDALDVRRAVDLACDLRRLGKRRCIFGAQPRWRGRRRRDRGRAIR